MIGHPDKRTMSRAANAIMSADDIVPGHDGSTTDFIFSITLCFRFQSFFLKATPMKWVLQNPTIWMHHSTVKIKQIGRMGSVLEKSVGPDRHYITSL